MSRLRVLLKRLRGVRRPPTGPLTTAERPPPTRYSSRPRRRRMSGLNATRERRRHRNREVTETRRSAARHRSAGPGPRRRIPRAHRPCSRDLVRSPRPGTRSTTTGSSDSCAAKPRATSSPLAPANETRGPATQARAEDNADGALGTPLPGAAVERAVDDDSS